MPRQKRQPPYWEEAKQYLSQNDHILAPIIQSFDPAKQLVSYQDMFYTFSKIIIGQQISVHAANAIFDRYTALLHHTITAKHFLQTPSEKVLATGFSRSKCRYLTTIAELICTTSFFEDYTQLQSAEAKEKKLCEIKGIGKWSSDMFLIFHDLEPDICPLGDIGLINAIKTYYKVTDTTMIADITKQWRPFSTVATWYLWGQYDGDCVNY